MAASNIIVVGGGLAGLMATIKAAEAGVHVHLFSLVPVKRSHSVCAQGGINGAVNTKGEGDSPWIHFDDSVYGGDFLANQPPVKAMCEAAPGIIHLMDRMGVMFNRTPEGLLDFRRFGGTQHHRTAFAGATTGQQLLYALDEQVRRWESAGLVTKYENWEFLQAVLDDEGICRGICGQDLRTMEVKTFAADAVILASGGPGIIFGKTTNSVINTAQPLVRCISKAYAMRTVSLSRFIRRLYQGMTSRVSCPSRHGEKAVVFGRIRTVSHGISSKKSIRLTEIWSLAILQHVKYSVYALMMDWVLMARTWSTSICPTRTRKSWM